MSTSITSFTIKSGVPQGSSILPTLYTLYTSDMPAPSEGCINNIHADDITQIITHPTKSRKKNRKRNQ